MCFDTVPMLGMDIQSLEYTDESHCKELRLGPLATPIYNEHKALFQGHCVWLRVLLMSLIGN
jgi:hypothetical protein